LLKLIQSFFRQPLDEAPAIGAFETGCMWAFALANFGLSRAAFSARWIDGD
jgi:hypothetical protein